MKSSAQALLDNGMYANGFNYVLLDDCWAYSRDETTQRLTWDPVRFPSGIPSLVSWLHDRGLKFGLYTSAGDETCNNGGRGSLVVPGSEGHYELDAQTFADWNVDHVKLDWCGDVKSVKYGFPKGKRLHHEFSNALSSANKTTPIFLEMVAGFWFLREDVAEYTNAWRFCEDHHDEWGSTLEALLCHVDQKVLHLEGTPSAWPYLDLMMIGGEGCAAPAGSPDFVPHCPKQSDDQYKTEFVVWSLLQSPMVVSTDVRVMTPIMTKALLHKDLVALHQDTTCKPGVFLGRDGERGLVFGRKIGDSCDDWMVALVNMSGKEWETVTLDMVGLLGFAGGEELGLYDMWDGVDMGKVQAGEYTTTVPPGGTVVLRVSKL